MIILLSATVTTNFIRLRPPLVITIGFLCLYSCLGKGGGKRMTVLITGALNRMKMSLAPKMNLTPCTFLNYLF